MFNPKVSVILPVYNPGIGVKKCLRSLMNQTLKEVEFIFIDDCGTDQAMSLIKRAAKLDKRIRIIKNEKNMGAGYSRNVGIKNAKGEYLSFVDPDDYIEENFLELLYNRTGDKPDVVKGMRRRVNIKGVVIDKRDNYNEKIIEGLRDNRPLFFLFKGGHCTAIYRREFILTIDAHYGRTSNNEDTTFLLLVTYYVRKIKFENKAYYNYVARKESSVRNFTEKRIWDELKEFRDKVAFLESCNNKKEETYKYINYFIVFLLKLEIAFLSNNNRYYESAVRYREALRQFINTVSFVDKLVYDNYVTKELISCGANLVTTPFEMEMNMPNFNEYKRIVTNWVGFVTHHPDCPYEYQIRTVFINAITYGDWRLNEQSKKKEHINEIRSMAKELPNPGILTDGFISMKLFVNYGINLFGLRNSRFGVIVRILLRQVRSLCSRLQS